MKSACHIRFVSFLLANCMLTGLLSWSVAASLGSGEQTAVPSGKRIQEEVGEGYRAYTSAFSDWTAAEQDIAADSRPSEILRRGDAYSFTLDIPKDATYEFSLEYRCETTQDILLRLEIDGKIPFPEAQRLTFPAFWKDAEESRRDGEGNELAPEQTLYSGDVNVRARDYSGLVELPYRFGLKEGRHVFIIMVAQGEFTLKQAALCAPEQSRPYKKAGQESLSEAAPEDVLIIEGESPFIKNSRSLIALSDRSSPMVHPSDPEKNKLNYIGGSNWKTPGSSLSWNFTVKTSGYYSLGFLYRQSALLGGVAYRHLMIDGKTPFEEAARVKFTYGNTWQYKDYASDGEPYLIYLEAGPHTLTLTSTVGAVSELYAAMRDITARMGNLYVDITMIVGETVDIYRSYELFNQIPDFNLRLEEIADDLHTMAASMESMQEKKSGSTVSLVRNAERAVRQMLENPYTAHRYKAGFYDAYTNLSSLMGEMVDMPLDIDRIYILGSGAQKPRTEPSLFQKIGFSLKRFFFALISDYSNAVGSSQDDLTIWVNWGRDQAQVLNAVIQDGFVRETGVPVHVSVVDATLIQGILAGKGPDCLLQMPRTDPVNFAMRGALLDLTCFPDLPDVAQRFSRGATIPYQYKAGTYALPDTQSFFMMFIRTDILKAMELAAPTTWDEFLDTAKLLQRSNLQVSTPYTQIVDSGTVNTGVGGLSLYPTLLIQNGLSLYNKELTASTLTETPQTHSFAGWVDWYTKYKIPVVMDFYNRFRVGSAPVGIAPYTLYTQLKAAAPEIDGRWTMMPIPGTRRSDGSLDHSSAGSGTGCAITKLSKNPENAWKFLKWWTSTETQLAYSSALESVIGPLGRIAAANQEAFKKMDWDADMLETLLLQQACTVEIPEVPGGYYTARGIDQAFWGAVEQGKRPTSTLAEWGEIVDREIARKTAEYSH